MPRKNENGGPVRVPKYAIARLNHLFSLANQKDYGRKVTFGDLVGEAILSFDESRIAVIQKASMTREEKTKAAHRRYQSIEQLSFDEFWDKLLEGDIPRTVLKNLRDQNLTSTQRSVKKAKSNPARIKSTRGKAEENKEPSRIEKQGAN